MIRPINIELDYECLKQWWIGHKWQPVPKNFLPSRGWMVPGVCAGFLYSTDSDIGMMEWVVSNPSAPPRKIYEGLQALVAHIQKEAQNDGYKALFTYIKNDALERLYASQGFQPTDRGVTNLIWRE
jgi:hypothetical protein